MKIGYIGLGKMGKNMVLRLLENGFEVVAWNRSPEPVIEVEKLGALGSASLEDLIEKLETPRVIWLMLPAFPTGEVIDLILNQIVARLAPGDIVIDGGNSFYKDSVRRGQMLTAKGINFLDVGVSGGPDGARNGASVMVGGDRETYDKLQKLWKAIAAPEAYAYLGPVGSGHFVKMVHNGIEYGMMEAIAEGAAILEKADLKLDLSEVFRIYNKHTVIESRLINWSQEIMAENPKLTGISSAIGQLGEGAWTVKVAREIGVDVPIIEASLDVRNESDKVPENFRNKFVSALRGKFGQHKVTK